MHGHHEKEMIQRHPALSAQGLKEAGNDVFGTIQEVIQKLEVDPETDWSKVDLEQLRQHLLDMCHFTINVEVISQEPISAGVKIVIRPTMPAASIALDRALSAHPKMMKKETGWDIKFTKTDHTYVITATTSKSDEIDKLRGLGYIGIMAYGKHHQPHHWAMATGKHPHY
ncbi:MAG: hypothetical protein QM504_00940 [Pseudomonadota bacterium]